MNARAIGGAQLFGLCCLLWLHLSELTRATPLAYTAGLVAALSVFLVSLLSERAAVSVIGLAMCLTPYFGSQGTNLAVVAFLAAGVLRALFAPSVRREMLLPFDGLFGWLAVGAVLSGVTTLMTEWDALLTTTITGEAGFLGLLRYWLANPARWNIPAIGVAGVLEMWWVYHMAEQILRRTGEARAWLLRGLTVGVCISSAVLVGQVLNLSPYLLLNQSAFWSLTGRLPATFSDPNAFGVVASFLAIFFALVVANRAGWIVAFLLVGGTLWSGSRTSVVLLSTAFIIHVALRLRQRRLLGVLCVIGAVVVVGIGAPPINERLQQLLPAASLARVLQTVNWERASEMLESRTVYARVALEVWRESPVVGVGWGRFFAEQLGAAERLGIRLGNWRDNANNFYLEMLVEGGCVGLATVVCAWFSAAASVRRFQSYRGEYAAIVAALAVGLVTGPHLLFDELRLAVALVLAFGGAFQLPQHRLQQVSRTVPRVFQLALFAIVLLHPAVASVSRDWLGWYGKEYGPDGDVVWSGKRASVRLCPKSAAPIILRLRALHPDIATAPVAVLLSTRLAGDSPQERSMQISSTAWTEVSIPVLQTETQKPITVEFSIDRLWSPAVQGGGDVRWLGIMLALPEGVCSPPS